MTRLPPRHEQEGLRYPTTGEEIECCSMRLGDCNWRHRAVLGVSPLGLPLVRSSISHRPIALWPHEWRWPNLREEFKILLVGEINPYGSNPRLALYHLPRGAAGDRLRRIFGLSDRAYVRNFDRINLCEGEWSSTLAARRAREIVEDGRWGVVVLLGRRVQDAFAGPPFFETTRLAVGRSPGSSSGPGSPLLVSLPHPSGRCRLWNDPSSVMRARQILRDAVPWGAWGGALDALDDGSPRGDAP
jgi:hypothetical protein